MKAQKKVNSWNMFSGAGDVHDQEILGFNKAIACLADGPRVSTQTAVHRHGYGIYVGDILQDTDFVPLLVKLSPVSGNKQFSVTGALYDGHEWTLIGDSIADAELVFDEKCHSDTVLQAKYYGYDSGIVLDTREIIINANLSVV